MGMSCNTRNTRRDAVERAQRKPLTFTVERVTDHDPDLSWLEDGGPSPEDPACAAHCAARLASYGDDWHMVGIVVTAMRSGEEVGHASVWGIESDSDESYFAEVAQDLKDELSAATLTRPCSPLSVPSAHEARHAMDTAPDGVADALRPARLDARTLRILAQGAEYMAASPDASSGRADLREAARTARAAAESI